MAFELSKALVNCGKHKVTVFTTDVYNEYRRFTPVNNPEIIEGIKVYRFANINNRLAFKNYPIALRFLYLNDIWDEFDIIHLHEFRSFQAISIHSIAQKYKIKYVLQGHGSLPATIGKQKMKRLYDLAIGTKILKDASRKIAVSEFELGLYNKIGISDNVIVIPNGISSKPYAINSRGHFRRKYGISTQYLILFLGRIHKIKGIGFLIMAFYKLQKHIKDVSLIIAGPDEGYKYELEVLISELHLGNKIKFVGPIKNVKEAYFDSDLLVYPSIFEVFGLVPLEALICGTPIIVTDGCGCGELIKKMDAGYLVHYGDTEDLMEKMKYILEHPDKAKEKVFNGKMYIKGNLSWDKLYDNFVEVYRECI